MSLGYAQTVQQQQRWGKTIATTFSTPARVCEGKNNNNNKRLTIRCSHVKFHDFNFPSRGFSEEAGSLGHSAHCKDERSMIPHFILISYFPQLDKVLKYTNFSLEIVSFKMYNFIFPQTIRHSEPYCPSSLNLCFIGRQAAREKCN